MHTRKWALGLLTASLALAGCVVDDDASESREDDAAADDNVRQFVVDVPADALQVHVDVTANATGGEPDTTVLIEDELGNNLATDTFSVAGSTHRRVSADVDGQARLVVTVRVVDGDATLDVAVSATVPAQPAPVVILQERVVFVEAAPAEPTPAADAPDEDDPAAATPPAQPSAPTAPVNETNVTNETNQTNATNASG